MKLKEKLLLDSIGFIGEFMAAWIFMIILMTPIWYRAVFTPY